MRPSDPPTLTVRGVVKSFGTRRVLDGIDLQVAHGERRVLVGPNGAGKTTLFDVISGLTLADSGTVALSGRDITRLSPHLRARRGLARTFQTTALFWELTLRQNLILALHGCSGSRSSLWPLGAQRRAAVAADGLLDQWELSSRRDVPVRLLSYGEQRQADILLAAAQQPALLLLDEPTAGLSLVETDRVVRAIRALSAETSILVTEHDMDVAARLGDTVSALEHGRASPAGRR